MPQLIPFRAVRYNQDSIDISSVISPPYDVISPQQRIELKSRSPYNFSLIELTDPSQDPQPTDQTYQDSCSLWNNLIDQGILSYEKEPCIYLLKQEFYNPQYKQLGDQSHTTADLAMSSDAPATLIRTAVFCGVELAEWSENKILPHEATLPKALGDRFALIEATDANYSPIFGMYPSNVQTDHAYNLLEQFVQEHDPCATGTELDGTQTALWKISGSNPIAQTFMSALSKESIVIADGHHRYTVALAHKKSARERVAPHITKDILPSDFVMMGLVKMDDPGLIVLPYHRIITPKDKNCSRPDHTLTTLKRYFTIEKFDGSANNLMTLLKQSELPSFGLVFKTSTEQESYIVRLNQKSIQQACDLINAPVQNRVTTQSTSSAEQSDTRRSMPSRDILASSMKMSRDVDHAQEYCLLDTVILQHLILNPCFGIDMTDKTSLEQLSFTHDLNEALAFESDQDQIVVIVRDLAVDKIMAVCNSGDVTPQKTTYFYPKLPSGFVMRDLRRERE